ncbi:MAG: S-layer homology domain-containing protein, partial [bacterium]
LMVLSGLGPTSAAFAAEPTLGAADTFWATAWNTGLYRHVEATVAYVGEHSVIYVENGHPVAPVTVSQLGDEFDSRVYPQLTAALGAEPNPGIDGDPRVVILLYAFGDPAYSGYFSPADIAPVPDETHSNRREMIYLDVGAVAGEPQNAGSLAAHEFAHLIVYYRDYVLDSTPGRAAEPSWLMEGFATYAEHIAGYDGRTNSLLRSFANDSDTNLTTWLDYRAHYGASYAFMSYLAVREGQDFIRDLVDYPADGVAGINHTLQARGTFETFDTLFNDWVVANFLDGRLPEVAPYRYPDIDVSASPLTVAGPLPKIGYQYVGNFGAVYLDFPATSPESVFSVIVDGQGGPPLRAALISWDSNGVQPPGVTFLTLAGGDGGVSVPAGHDRHTLAVWARGAVGESSLYAFHYSAAADPPGGVQFLDLDANDPYFPYVSELLMRHVISGKEIPPGSGLWYFKGTDNVLRAQFAKMIMEAIGRHTLAIDNLYDPTFSDVRVTYDQSGDPQAYPYDYVEEAASLGIVNGFVDGTFRPYSPITRGQLVLMIIRGASAAGKPLPAYTGGATVFVDVVPSNPIYREIMTAYAAGILGGSIGKDGRLYFYPYSSASRNHVAKMTANLINIMDSSAATASGQSGP